MAKLTPMMMKKKKMEGSAKKTEEKKKIVFEDDDDESDDEDFNSEDEIEDNSELSDLENGEDDSDNLEDNSDLSDLEKGEDDSSDLDDSDLDEEDEEDDDEEDDDEEAPELVNKPPNAKSPKQQSLNTPNKQQKTPLKKETKTPQKPEAKTPVQLKKGKQTPAKTPLAKTPIETKKGKQTPAKTPKGKKEEEVVESDVEMSSEEVESDGDISTDEIKEENGKAKKGGVKRKAEDDIAETPKRLTFAFDCGNDEIKAQIKRIEELQCRSLFIRFPLDTTVEQVKELSSDILSVRIGRNKVDAVIGFADESTAEKNLKQLSQKSIGDKTVSVEYTGVKTGRTPTFFGTRFVHALDRLKLQVSPLPEGTTEADLKSAFPKSKEVEISTGYPNAHVTFSSEKDAKEAFESSLDKVINKQRVDVIYAAILMPPNNSPGKSFKKRRGNFSRGSPKPGQEKRQSGSFNRGKGGKGGFRGRGGNRGRGRQ